MSGISGISDGIPIPNMPGVRIDPSAWNASKFNTTSRMQECNPVTIDGVDYVARIGMRPGTEEEEKQRIRACVYERLPIYDIESILSMPDGSFLYLVSDKGMFMNQVRSKLEIGSLHAILAHRTAAEVVYCAGEMRMTTLADGKRRLEYNQMSGTYMLFRKVDAKESMDFMHAVFGHIANTYKDTIEVVFRDGEDFVNVPLVTEEVDAMRRCGYQVDVFAKANEGFCKAGKFLRKYLKDYDEHVAIYMSIPEPSGKQKMDKKQWIMNQIVFPLLHLLKANKAIPDDTYTRLSRSEDPFETMRELQSIVNMDEMLAALNSKKVSGGGKQRRRTVKRTQQRRNIRRRKTRQRK